MFFPGKKAYWMGEYIGFLSSKVLMRLARHCVSIFRPDSSMVRGRALSEVHGLVVSFGMGYMVPSFSSRGTFPVSYMLFEEV